jgi:hypothetical protein
MESTIKVYWTRYEELPNLAKALENKLNELRLRGCRVIDIKYSTMFENWNNCRGTRHIALIIYETKG